MLSEKALRDGPTGDLSVDFLRYPHNGVDPREYIKDTDTQTGEAVIQMIQESYTEQGVSFTKEEMLESARASLNLTDEEMTQIFPTPDDQVQVAETFTGFIYLGSLWVSEFFERAMRTEFSNHQGSHLDVIKREGVKPVVGEMHRLLKGETGGS
jgi:hypothetical protein